MSQVDRTGRAAPPGSDVAGTARAYAQIRAAIVENRYAPGQRLVEQHIAAEFDLSRTPVREALRRLEAEGLVTSERNRGAVVRPISAADVVDLYELRGRLESYAAELAAQRATEIEIVAIQHAAHGFSRVQRSGDVADLEFVRELNAANRAIHDGIVVAAHHDRLASMLSRTVDIPLVFRSFRSFDRMQLERSDLFHHLIADAIAARAPRRAARLMSEHIAQGLDALLAGMPAEPDDDLSPPPRPNRSKRQRGS
jgi:DNA-binding GntR family transcriptional regulator